jgi:hypothetical protein
MGRPRGAVRQRAVRLGLSFRRHGQFVRLAAIRAKPAPEVRAAMERARQAGMEAKRPIYEAGRRAAISATRLRKVGLGDAPPHVIARYRALRSREFPSAEAVRIVLDEWATEIRRAIAAICRAAADHARAELARHNTFEAKLARVAAGKARVVPALRLSRPVSDDRSLTGNAWGMM